MKIDISKTLNALQSKEQPLKKQTIGVITVFILIMAATVWISSYYQTTGRYPISFLNRTEGVLPAKMASENQTFEQIINFLQSDNTDTIKYGVGFNCVDATFRLWRNAYWEGIKAYPIVIQYTESPGHMIIAFPTKDRGDIFIEPQSDLQVRPRVGQNFNDRKVKGFYVLDYNPYPLDNSPQYDFNLDPE